MLLISLFLIKVDFLLPQTAKFDKSVSITFSFPDT